MRRSVWRVGTEDVPTLRGWHIIETAQMLGISRKSLWEKMLKHGIRVQPRREPV